MIFFQTTCCIRLCYYRVCDYCVLLAAIAFFQRVLYYVHISFIVYEITTISDMLMTLHY